MGSPWKPCPLLELEIETRRAPSGSFGAQVTLPLIDATSPHSSIGPCPILPLIFRATTRLFRAFVAVTGRSGYQLGRAITDDKKAIAAHSQVEVNSIYLKGDSQEGLMLDLIRCFPSAPAPRGTNCTLREKGENESSSVLRFDRYGGNRLLGGICSGERRNPRCGEESSPCGFMKASQRGWMLKGCLFSPATYLPSNPACYMLHRVSTAYPPTLWAFIS